MIVVSMAAIHIGEILHGSFPAVTRIDSSGVAGIAGNSVCGLHYRSCQSSRHRQFASGEAAAYRENAAGAVDEFASQVRRDLVKLAFLEPKIGQRIDRG